MDTSGPPWGGPARRVAGFGRNRNGLTGVGVWGHRDALSWLVSLGLAALGRHAGLGRGPEPRCLMSRYRDRAAYAAGVSIGCRRSSHFSFPSPLRGDGRGEGRMLAGTCVLSVGAHPVRDSHAWVYRSVGLSRTGCAPTVDLQLLALGSWLLALGSWLLALGSQGSPYDAAGGWRIARRVARMDAGQFFARAGCPVEKPRSPPAHLEGEARKARHPGALLFGYFLLGKQEKVTRPPAGGRKPAAGEPGRRISTTKHRGSGSRPAPG